MIDLGLLVSHRETSISQASVSWLFLLFNLPAKHSSERVKVWRRLKKFGAVQLNIALTALVIGSALLLLSAFWHQARRAIVRPLPESLRDRLPIVDRSAVVSQPAA